MVVAIVGTLDTKGTEIGFAREVLESQGIDTHVVDVGVLGEPEIEADTRREEVASLAGTTIEELAEGGDRGVAVETMADGAAAAVSRLEDGGELEGVLGLGGSAGTTIGTAAMRELPYGLPKVMVSTMASGDTRPYVGASDVMMLYSVTDIAGLNRLSRRIIANGALAVAGMVGAEVAIEDERGPTVATTMFGVTTPCVERAREVLEERGYEVMVFHATGTGGQAMEALVEQGIVDAVLDVTTTELADELVGGVLSAGPDRLEAAGDRGLPQIVSVGALDMVNFGPIDEVPDRFSDRTLHEHNPSVTLMRTTPEENRELGRLLAEKLNAAEGPTAIALPLSGVSALDVEGEPFHDPAADAALFSAIREGVGPTVEVIEYEGAINDDAFAETIARRIDEMVGEVQGTN